MPIRPENRALYAGGSPNSKEWKALRDTIMLRAGNRCERCGVPHWSIRWGPRALGPRCTGGYIETYRIDRTTEPFPTYKEAADECRRMLEQDKAQSGLSRIRAAVIILTIAHLDHDPTHNEPANLRALCQRCHNRHDAEHRKANAAATRARKGSG